MTGRFYPEVFAPTGIALITPTSEEMAFIHDAYMSELVNGIFRPDARDRLLAIIRRMRASDGIEGLILGGTELPLILTEPSYEGIPMLDTTALHVARIVDEMLRA
jgi:aspartate racemase